MAVSRVERIEHHGALIVCIDLTKASPAEVREAIGRAAPLIYTGQPGTVLTMTLATDVAITRDTVGDLREFLSANKPYVKAAAIVGASGLATAVLATLRLVTGRELATFSDVEEAKDWLASK